jgi:hypothetical protein
MQELNMTRSAIGPLLAASIIGALALASPAVAKTAKECRAEWSANKAANQAKGVTEKAYVDRCRAADATPKGAAKETAKETAKDKKAAAKETKEKAAAKEAKTAAPGGEKTAKQCADEWRANKAANQAAKITEKAYVADCRSGKTAMTPPAAAPAAKTESKTETKMAPPPAKAETKTEKKSTMTPASAPAKPATTAAAPASGKPEAANQYAAEGQAKSHCPSGLVVWANLDSKIYHFSGHNDYGHTKQGAYMCEADAEAQGMRAAKNEKHP